MHARSNLSESDCAGFYHWPPLWIGAPPVEQGGDFTPAVMNAEVFSATLQCGVSLKVSRQGLFVFDFAQWGPGSSALANNPLDNWEERVFTRMRVMNLFLACFYTSVHRIQKSTSGKLFIDYTTYIAARSFALDPRHVECDLRTRSVIKDAEAWHRRFKPVCTTVPGKVLHAAAEMTDAAIAQGFPGVAVLAELLLHAFYLHESGKYEGSHITAWTIAERCLRELWKTHLGQLDSQYTGADSEEKFINSERKQKLTGGDFTASVISEKLSLAGVLPCDRYKLVSQVRKTRNAWLHDLHAIGREDAGKAIVLAQFMLRETGVLDVDILFPVFGTMPIAWVGD
ncbi:MAG TPA: hypothetical protein VMZ31_12650 [Phycisphaerae bacterium]|nr:hypothetical protein [Phycisphaerae bacterium]